MEFYVYIFAHHLQINSCVVGWDVGFYFSQHSKKVHFVCNTGVDGWIANFKHIDPSAVVSTH
jgi:hypothetical protein